ncbi:hypothetical protein PPL_08224 [Heterostelium album PN500]|uniref:DEP domain-containing protein n=1 Tax=Heterostelium pallidum (strain ATCC 26659 / Pp 5 / PN500) TaxID=670386 RepID=D3BIY9_HETP5|nr:hypothetical protein PPL_08224 [Heterostelium album PN500]EFA78763.1 hypothetical protein PPL_08224 [Heterostelium album PN500]|eukprot:XP_020430887.1 hypothetical protein PPL_08224 [Heterostelium album PN500]
MSLLREDEVELLESKLRDSTKGIIPKLSGDSFIKGSEVIDWMVANMSVSRVKASEYGQMLWNRGVFDHIAPHPFSDDGQLFRLKPSEASPRKPVDDQQWNQLKQDAANKDTSNVDPIAKLHKSIENATKVYQRLLRDKNQTASPNILLGLKLLDQTLNLIASNSGSNSSNVVHPCYSQILHLLNNPDAEVVANNNNNNNSTSTTTPTPAPTPSTNSNSNSSSKKTTTTQDSTKKTTTGSTTKTTNTTATTTTTNNNKTKEQEIQELTDALAFSERLEIGLVQQLNLAHQQTTLLKTLKKK